MSENQKNVKYSMVLLCMCSLDEVRLNQPDEVLGVKWTVQI